MNETFNVGRYLKKIADEAGTKKSPVFVYIPPENE